MLEIRNLQVSVGEKAVLKGINLVVKPGEVHAIMGPNGSGKSTLSHVIAGREDYIVKGGSISFEGKDIFEMDIETRAREGIFLAFQYPVEIPGVNSMNFLKTAVNAHRKARGEQELDAVEFLKLVREKQALLGVDDALLKRAVNSGFSGGEKKRFEMLQMALLEPKLAILDETDSGLDIDALRIVSEGVNSLRAPNRSFVVITHYNRILNYIVPDVIHVLAEGTIITSGDKSLALHLEDVGYEALIEEAKGGVSA